jgi:tetratricopeptide (TPR) repeat protein
MRRGAHRSRPSDRDSGQIRLDFEATPIAPPVGANVVSLLARRAAAAERRAVAGRAGTPILDDSTAPGAEDAGGRSAADWFELGYELEATSLEQARDAYARAIALDDGHADAHLNLGRLLHEAGDLDTAERHYRRALEAAPHEATAAFNLGVVLEDLRREIQAIAAYERAIEADPDFTDAYHNTVRLYEKRGDKAAAVRVLKRLRERTR